MDKEIGTLKDGIKEIIETFMKSLGPSKTEKIMSMIQKTSQDVETMKIFHERKIDKLEEYVNEIKDNLSNLVEINSEAIGNSIEGLEKINAMMVNYRTKPIASDPPLWEKQKKNAWEGGQSVARGKTSSGPYTRTRSWSQYQVMSRFIIEDLEKINKKIIQKNTELVHSLSWVIFLGFWGLFILFLALCLCVVYTLFRLCLISFWLLALVYKTLGFRSL